MNAETRHATVGHGWQLACAIAFTALIGCRGGAHGAAAAHAPDSPLAVAAAAGENTPLLERVHEIARQLAPHGVTLAGVAASGFITHGLGITTAFEVPAHRCLSIIALASSGVRDLDAHLYDPEGTLVVEDVETDPHPTVQVCATDARRVYHLMEAYDGQGAYIIASFVTDRPGLDEIARVMGGHPGTATGISVERTGADRRLADVRDGIARRGFLPSGELARADFQTSGALRFPLAVTPDRCYTLAAIADGDISDADLAVYADSGEEIARDVRSERDAFVQFCPPAATSLSVEVRARPGAGAVLLQAFAADAATVGGANTLWLGERLAWAANAVALNEVEGTVLHAMGTLGYGTQVARHAISLAPGEVHELPVSVPAGRCTAIAAIGGRGLGRLGLEVFNAAGDRVARGAFRGGASVAVLCPASVENVRATVTSEVGGGDASVQILAGGAVPGWAAGADPVAVSESLASLWVAPPEWSVAGTPEKVRIGAASERVIEYDRAAGRCVRFGVSSGSASAWVALSLRAPNGALLSNATAQGSAVVTRCGAASEHMQVVTRTDPPDAPAGDAVITRWERGLP